MSTNEDIERYLIQMDLPYEELEDGMWIIHDEQQHVDNIVVIHTPPVVVVRVKLLEMTEKPPIEFYETLLRLNATEMVAGAYGMEDNNVVVMDSIQSENLDFNEFQASVDALAMAIGDHYPRLIKFFPSKTEDTKTQE